MTTTASPTDLTDVSGLAYRDALARQATELDRTLEVLGTLDDADWSAPTDCPDWDVRGMELHVLGACEAGASMRENAHQMRAAMRHRKVNGGTLEQALSHVQVADRRALTPAQLVERLGAVAPKTIAGRGRLPGLVRRVTVGVDGPVVERWSLDYLTGTIYLRDLWMHRIDVCRATGRPLELTADHDGVIVRDVVAEWMRRHGEAVTVVLTGPAGGAYTSSGRDTGAPAGDPIELDAIELCRILAGRAPAPSGLLETIVPF